MKKMPMYWNIIIWFNGQLFKQFYILLDKQKFGFLELCKIAKKVRLVRKVAITR